MRFSLSLLILALGCSSCFAQSSQRQPEPYSVSCSDWTAVSPTQPPPDSELAKLKQDQYQLEWAKAKIEILEKGLTLHEWNAAIENSTYSE